MFAKPQLEGASPITPRRHNHKYGDWMLSDHIVYYHAFV